MLVCAASQLVDMTSTELLLTANDSLSVSCVGESSSLVWYHQQRRITVRPSSALCSRLDMFINKSSAVAEMGDRGHNRYGRK